MNILLDLLRQRMSRSHLWKMTKGKILEGVFGKSSSNVPSSKQLTNSSQPSISHQAFHPRR